MDLKKLDLGNALEKAEELAKKIGADKTLLASFTKEPVKTLETKFGLICQMNRSTSWWMPSKPS